jgi:outer membrane lipoprotein carrier protein
MSRGWPGALLILLCASSAWGADGPIDKQALQEVRDIVKHIQARYEKTRDLQADFVQKTKIEGFERPVTSTGKVYLKKPGRLRWDYLEPANEQIYVSHDDVKVYVPEHKQVLVGKLTQMAASKAPLELLQGAGKLDESFDIQPTAGNERGMGGIRLITLIPKAKEQESARNLQRIIVEVFPKTFFLRTVALHEISGNVATFEFSELKSNEGLANEVFDFKAPPDVEVVKAPVLNGP